jgi:hypothetical protein
MVDGEAEIGLTQISEILPYAGAELVGPLPSEVQLPHGEAPAFAAGTGSRAICWASAMPRRPNNAIR